MVIDYWAHAHLDNPELRKEDVTDDYAELAAQMEAEAIALGSTRELIEQRIAREAAEAEAAAKPAPAAPAPVSVSQEVVPLAPEEVEDVAKD